MSTFVSRVKNLSQKAAELRAAMQQLPPKVAEVRQAVAATTGQLQQLKTEIHTSVADLKADDEVRLSHALQEIEDSADEFQKAGFLLSGVDLEISPVQRMLLHFSRLEDVHPSVLRSLISANQHRRRTQAILSAMLQARQMSDSVELNGLAYDELMVGIGPIPTVRLSWRPEENPTPAATPVTPPPLSAPQMPAQSVFGQSSFFERPAIAPSASSASPVVATPAVAPVLASEPAKETAVAATLNKAEESESSADPLARFKKMPSLGSRPK